MRRLIVRARSVTLFAVALLALAATSLSSAAPALAKSLKAEFKPFSECPIKGEPATEACVYAKSGEGSSFTVGRTTVPLNKPIVLQGGLVEQESEESPFRFVGAENGETLISKGQAVPGGISTIVDASDLSGKAAKSYAKAIEAGHTTATATIELAGLASTIVLNEGNLLGGEGTALGLPVRVHLKGALLGKTCYVGSEGDPVVIDLTTGTTAPPPPNEPISGRVGKPEFNTAGTILTITEDRLVNNSYAAPGAEGCGSATDSAEVDAAVDAGVGLPSAAGNNSAIITGTLKQGGAEAVAEALGL